MIFEVGHDMCDFGLPRCVGDVQITKMSRMHHAPVGITHAQRIRINAFVSDGHVDFDKGIGASCVNDQVRVLRILLLGGGTRVSG